MRFDILTLFPEATDTYGRVSILGRAQQDGHITIRSWNIRDYATDKHQTVDDTPYGGGPGMVMKVEPIDRALGAVKIDTPDMNRKIIVLSAKGKPFTQEVAQEFARLDQLILICGRYEGIDQRVADFLADEEISIGPYVLAGGELPALTVVEATARNVSGVLGNPESLTEESFSNPETLIEYPQYTKPETYNGHAVPPVLLSGNHGEIGKWRKSISNDSVEI